MRYRVPLYIVGHPLFDAPCRDAVLEIQAVTRRPLCHYTRSDPDDNPESGSQAAPRAGRSVADDRYPAVCPCSNRHYENANVVAFCTDLARLQQFAELNVSALT